LFKAMSGIDIVDVRLEGRSGARNDIFGGQVQMMFRCDHNHGGQCRCVPSACVVDQWTDAVDRVARCTTILEAGVLGDGSNNLDPLSPD
jgi:hypothetical protein